MRLLRGAAPQHRGFCYTDSSAIKGQKRQAAPPRYASATHVRGVAQPGRAPGSGPGGRRFKSSLPDHIIQAFTDSLRTRESTLWFWPRCLGAERCVNIELFAKSRMQDHLQEYLQSEI